MLYVRVSYSCTDETSCSSCLERLTMSRTTRKSGYTQHRNMGTANVRKNILATADELLDAAKDEEMPYIPAVNNIKSYKRYPSAYDDVNYCTNENYFDAKKYKVYYALRNYTQIKGCIGWAHLAYELKMSPVATKLCLDMLEKEGLAKSDGLGVYTTSL